MYLQDTIAIGSQNSKQLGNTQTQRHKCYCTAIAKYAFFGWKYAFFLFWQVSSHVLGYRMITSKGQSCATRCFLFEALIDLLDVYKRFSRVHSFKETSINNFLINSLRQPCRLCIVSLWINFRIAIAISGRETKDGKIRGISDTF